MISVNHPAVIEPGVYFDMPEEQYHRALALSSHGVQWLRVSGYDWWARCPALNPDYEEPESSEAKEVGKAFDARIVEGREVFRSRYAEALDRADYPEALQTNEELHAALARHLIKVPKNTLKADLIARLLAVQPDAMIWGTLIDEHRAQHDGKVLLPTGLIHKIEVAAAFIENDPNLSKAFSGGAPQVSVFWVDNYGVPCKARLDYLKSRAIIDLKTTSRDYIALKRAFALDIRAYRYCLQARFYLEAGEMARNLIRQGLYEGAASSNAFLDALMTDANPFTFMWVVQRKGVAPMAKGFIAPPPTSGVMSQAAYQIDEAARTFAQCWETFGPEPWIVPEGIEEYDDSEIPPSFDG